jgi:hypothetical protein
LLAGLQADRVPGVRSFLLRWGATGVLGVSLLATLAKAAGLLEQDNLRMILLALPLNIAAAWTAWRLTALRPADEVAAP